MLVLTPILLFLTPLVRSWTVTSYFERETVTVDDYGPITPSASLETRLVPVEPTRDDPSAIETISTVLSRGPGIDYQKVVLEPGQGELQTDSADDTETTYDQYVVFTFTKPSGCTYITGSVSTTSASLSITQGAGDIGTPTSTHASTTTLPYIFSTQVSVQVDAYLDPEELPTSLLEHVRASAYPSVYSRCELSHYDGDGDFSMCSDYYDGLRGSPIGGGYECSNGKYHTWGLYPWQVVVAVVGAWAVLLLALGILRAATQFRRLMVGRQAKRGLPTAFGWIIPVVCLPLLALSNRGVQTRSEAERTLLKEQWDKMPLKTKFHLFLKYGFTRDYPTTILGSSPEPVQANRTSAPPPRRQSTTHQLEEGEQPPPPYSAEAPPKYSEDESR